MGSIAHFGNYFNRSISFGSLINHPIEVKLSLQGSGRDYQNNGEVDLSRNKPSSGLFFMG